MSAPPELTLSPSSVTFDAEGRSALRVTSGASQAVAFKVKTNRPEAFIVKPAEGLLLKRGDVVDIAVKPMSEAFRPNAEDKFLLVYTTVNQDVAVSLDQAKKQGDKAVLAGAFRDFWKTVDPNDMRKIRIPQSPGSRSSQPQSQSQSQQPAGISSSSANAPVPSASKPAKGASVVDKGAETPTNNTALAPSASRMPELHKPAPTSKSGSNSNKALLVGVGVGGVLLVAGLAVAYELHRRGMLGGG